MGGGRRPLPESIRLLLAHKQCAPLGLEGGRCLLPKKPLGVWLLQGRRRLGCVVSFNVVVRGFTTFLFPVLLACAGGMGSHLAAGPCFCLLQCNIASIHSRS